MNKADLKKQIGYRLKELRVELNFKQLDLSEIVNEHRSVLGQVEIGNAFPNGGILYYLYHELNVSIDWLISGKGLMFVDKKIEDLKIRDLFPDLPEIDKWEKFFSIINEDKMQSYLRLAVLQNDEIINKEMYIEKNFRTLTNISDIVKEREERQKQVKQNALTK